MDRRNINALNTAWSTVCKNCILLNKFFLQWHFKSIIMLRSIKTCINFFFCSCFLAISLPYSFSRPLYLDALGASCTTCANVPFDYHTNGTIHTKNGRRVAAWEQCVGVHRDVWCTVTEPVRLFTVRTQPQVVFFVSSIPSSLSLHHASEQIFDFYLFSFFLL